MILFLLYTNYNILYLTVIKKIMKNIETLDFWTELLKVKVV